MPKFNSAHLYDIAHVLKKSKPVLTKELTKDDRDYFQFQYWEHLVGEFAAFFEITQPTFNKERFTMACGIVPEMHPK